jgi:hypothetical protein
VRLPDVLSSAHFPSTELAALRLAGELYAVGPAWVPVDLPETDAARAASLAAVLDPRLIADRRSAAWVLGGSDAPPGTPQTCVPVTARAAARDPVLDVREVRLQDGDTRVLAGLRLTTALRTALDLLRGAGYDAATAAIVGRLLQRRDCPIAGLEALLGERRFAGHAARSRARLCELSPR